MVPRPAPALGAELQQTLELLHRLFLEVDSAGGVPANDERVREIVMQLRRQPHLATLPKVLLRVYVELAEALNGVRLTREAIQSYSVERLRDTHARLTEVSATTESAALEMLNGLDRSLAHIDAMERDCPASVRTHCHAIRAEVNQLYGALQFQDIITQQLHGVGALLVEVEQRLEAVASLFDETAAPPNGEDLPGTPDPACYNPDASMRDTSARQALIDQAFTAARTAAPPA
ncbi:MAG TPA: hypothetical protein VEB59_15055 [Gemmatimonadales bacterium]|nr:hypothetical protein [Gemmatimonadales bacterium]